MAKSEMRAGHYAAVQITKNYNLQRQTKSNPDATIVLFTLQNIATKGCE